jgi:chemotaxis protein histidine kinase CheA
MEQRVLALGGTMQIDSAPGQGVSVRVEVPLTTSVLAPPEEAEKEAEL